MWTSLLLFLLKLILMLIGFLGKYVLNILISLDQFGNSILLGDPDETISSRIGRIKRKWGGTIPWRRPISKLVYMILEDIDPGHCDRAIEDNEGRNGLVDRIYYKRGKCDET